MQYFTVVIWDIDNCISLVQCFWRWYWLCLLLLTSTANVPWNGWRTVDSLKRLRCQRKTFIFVWRDLKKLPYVNNLGSHTLWTTDWTFWNISCTFKVSNITYCTDQNHHPIKGTTCTSCHSSPKWILGKNLCNCWQNEPPEDVAVTGVLMLLPKLCCPLHFAPGESSVNCFLQESFESGLAQHGRGRGDGGWRERTREWLRCSTDGRGLEWFRARVHQLISLLTS